MMDHRLNATWLQRLTGLVALVGVLALSACGGGSGAPSKLNAPQPAPPALTVNPSSATIFTNVAATLTITGGEAPYQAFSSNSAVLPVTTNLPGNTITLLAGNVTSTTLVTITIRDSAGTQVTASITILPGPATPPPALTVLPSPVDIFAGIATQLTVAGGVPPYRAFSSNPTVLPVTPVVSGTTVNLIANDVAANTVVTVTIKDFVDQTTPVTVTVHPKGGSAPPLVVLPNTIVTSKGIPVTLTISGGLAPYKAYSSNPFVIPVNQSVTGHSLVLVAGAVADNTSVAITIQDSAGQTVVASVTVQTTQGPPLAILPANAIIFSGVPTSVIVTGGQAPYQAFSSNPAVLPVTQSVAGNAIPLLAANVGADTNVTLTVQDSANVTATATITVRAAALLNSLVVKPNIPTCGTQAICSGQSGTATVTVQLPGGGPAPGRQVRFDVIAGPYSIAASGSSPSVPSQVVVSDVAGHAQVIIKANVDAPTQPAEIRATDIASGQQITTDFLIIQVTDGSTVFSVVPPEATITSSFVGECTIGFQTDYYIYGGTPPYRITQTFPDASVIVNPTVTVSGGFFEVITNGTCVNPQTFSILDATGRQITAKLFNLPGTATRPVVTPPALAIVPENVAVNCSQADTVVDFVITGGTPPYNASIAPRDINGNPHIFASNQSITATTPPTFNSTPVVNRSGGFFEIRDLDQIAGQTQYVVSFIDSSDPKKTLTRTITCTN